MTDLVGEGPEMTLARPSRKQQQLQPGCCAGNICAPRQPPGVALALGSEAARSLVHNLRTASPTLTVSQVKLHEIPAFLAADLVSAMTRSPRVLSLGVALLAALVILPLAAAAAPPAKARQAQAIQIPRLANGRPDFSGIWQTTSAADFDLEPHGARRDAPPGPGVVEGGEIPYLPKSLAQRDENFRNRLTHDPRLKGWTLGVPRGIYHPEPFQVFQRPRDLKLVFQFGHSVRTIHTNDTQHPDDAPEYLLGDSRGHWEGDTLVVDVRHFTDQTWLDRAGNFHSTELHVVERWRLLDEHTIDYQATLEDPQVFSRPWRLGVLLHRHREKHFQLVPDYRFTLEFDDFYPPRKDAP